MTPNAEQGDAPAAVASYEAWHAPHNPWLITIVATLATFMEILDTTIVNVALPHIAGNLGADVTDSTWVLTSYLVSNAIILPVSAYCSSLFGRRNYFMICIALFTLSSLLCGLAPSLGLLVVFRLLQGVGGGGLQPISQAILVDTFPPQRRGMGMAAFGMTVVVAPVIGPTLGGWITDNYSWRWIFFINIPVGLLALSLVPRLISDPPYLVRRLGRDRFRADYIGLGLLTLGLGCLQMMLDLGQRKDWFESQFIVALCAISAVALVMAVIWELRCKDPVLDLHLLRDRNLGFATLLMFVFGCTLYGSTVLLPLFMQTLLGYNAMLSGLAISPGGLVTMCLLPFIGIMLSRMDARIMIASGIAIVSFSLFYMARFNLQIDFWTIVLARVGQGIGFAFIFVPVNTVAYAYVPREGRNSASSLMSVTRNLGGSIGIAFAASMIARSSQRHLTYLTGHLTPYDTGFTETLRSTMRTFFAYTGDPVLATSQAYAALYGFVQQQAATLAFVDVFRFFAYSLFVIVPIAWFMKRPPHETQGIPAPAGRE